jgi:hypothetical protein
VAVWAKDMNLFGGIWPGLKKTHRLTGSGLMFASMPANTMSHFCPLIDRIEKLTHVGAMEKKPSCFKCRAPIAMSNHTKGAFTNLVNLPDLEPL